MTWMYFWWLLLGLEELRNYILISSHKIRSDKSNKSNSDQKLISLIYEFYCVYYPLNHNMSVIRVLYSLAASSHAVVTLLEVGYYMLYMITYGFQHETTFQYGVSVALLVYEVFLFFLAVAQLFAHLGFLWGMR